MFPSRKKFRSKVVPSDRQLWAIGMVAVQWSAVEAMSKIYVQGLTDENEPARLEFEKTWSSGPRLDQWERLAQERVQPPWKGPLLKLINEVRQAQELRDKIIHGTWGDEQNAQSAE